MKQSQPYRVLQVTAALHEGGVEQGTTDLACYLSQHGYNSWVASAGGSKVAELEAANIPHIQLPLTYRNPFIICYNAWNIWRLLRQQHFQLVHARSRAPAWASWLAYQLYNLTNPQTPVVFLTSWHGTHGHSTAFKRFYNGIMHRGKKVIAISTFIKQHILAHYPVPEAKITVIPRGADPKLFAPTAANTQALRQELGLDATTPVLLLVGRFTRWKGQLIALKALAQLTDLPWVLLLAGGADKKQTYRTQVAATIAEHNLTDRVHLLGSRTDTPALYSLANLALSTSTNPEAFGRVAVEAQMSGTPIIATAHGGSLETVQNGVTGWLIPPGDADALASCLRDALTQPEKLAKMGTAARNWAMGHYTTQQTCQAEEAVYRSLLEKQDQ